MAGTSLDKYDGNTDPANHIEALKAKLMLYGSFEGLMCKTLVATLTGPTLTWYSSLPPCSIASLEQMETQFHARDYLARFKKEALQVRNLNQSVAVIAIQHGLHPSPFNFSISKNPLQTLVVLMSHVQKCINVEEVQTQLRDEKERSDKKMRDTEERKSERSDQHHKRQDHRPDHKPQKPPPTYRNSTPLNMSRFEVLMQIDDCNYVRWPEKMKMQSNKRSRDKYCEFHRDHGHDMENFFDMHNHIEDLIRGGYLGGFVDKSEKPVQEEQRTERRIAVGGESSKGHKKYALLCEIDNRGHKKKRDQSITFTDNDLRGVQTPHDDALVITSEVANFEVRRILVDTGSFVDVPFEDAFEKLGIDKERLTLVNTPLMGFFGESLLPTGRITLSLLIGDGDITMTTMVEFIVVRCPSSYNAILGRLTLNALHATVSTFHLAMKFPTEYGIGVAHGDQRTAPQCYLLSCRGPCPVTETLMAKVYDLRDELRAQRGQPVEDPIWVPLNEEDPERMV
ncbi:PREDICTED: uncharacterized protein LOC104586896 [Nelumbo nucifera]|uniref:Uncharacterized protein LOC104586896 n=1 Tax=Nelumbo nucifera TaxID=4432 RepID=A0A1U7YR33_NELNU|nr:PREDICTED: uncharacterized protein LOC104586896 [Nelumbo nucifera]